MTKPMRRTVRSYSYRNFRQVNVLISYAHLLRLYEMNLVFPDSSLSDILGLAVEFLYLMVSGSWDDVYRVD